ncbi:TSC22 domain family protein 1 isoform X2 [Frankliniella occidentalis]|uniref:TSC22 domain family protein 1 isoform X2 n=1 Tax=Frankliniella occidentalis TaxID=133901 RepID=A0A9C6XB75_FRAOC|nr:TSC22 domain family protein 1 isoform X2 [Frankliniella occidentalis]
MLNCTDLECILHHHHYHHHLHQLQHHLQDGHHAGVADPASEGDDVLHLLNSTDGELSGSHLDAPISESVYIVCGVLIAMVLVGLIIVLLAVTISHNGITTTVEAAAVNNTTATVAGFAVIGSQTAVVANNNVAVSTVIPVTAAAASPPTSCPDSADSASSGLEDDDEESDGVVKSAPLELFLWSHPDPTAFSGTKDTLVRELPCEVPQDSKGLRKNLRGKWKRLVKKKPEDSCSIPPELRDQLKQIYVY